MCGLNTIYRIGTMKKVTRSILEELNNLNLHWDKESLIESTGHNLIQSTINLFEKIHNHYSPDEAVELERGSLTVLRVLIPGNLSVVSKK